MKKLFVVIIPLLTALSSCAQEVSQSLVPSVVVNTFKQKFPNASDIEWEKKGNLYEAEFEVGHQDHKALLDETGKIVKHKQEVSVSELPVAVKETIQKGFPNYKIEEAKRIETAGLVIYKIELENRIEEKKIYIGEDGRIIETPSTYE